MSKLVHLINGDAYKVSVRDQKVLLETSSERYLCPTDVEIELTKTEVSELARNLNSAVIDIIGNKQIEFDFMRDANN